jgi:FlaA1/EpsC-like NDP-sugar epimerase
VNLYGATKLTSDRMFISANSSYAGGHNTHFSVVRYGNVMGSRGSVIPFFLSCCKDGVFPITDMKMTRFMITLEAGVELVWHAFDDMVGGEIYVKKIPSMKVTEIAKSISKDAKLDVIGIRPGEKIHEQMIGEEDAMYTFEYDEHYKILPSINKWYMDKNRINEGIKVDPNFIYSSDKNIDWMSQETLQSWIKKNSSEIVNY